VFSRQSLLGVGALRGIGKPVFGGGTVRRSGALLGSRSMCRHRTLRRLPTLIMISGE